jgi:hypothetical protein
MESCLLDPGLVENSSEAEHCLHACLQMVLRSRTGGYVSSFAELDTILERRPGNYAWPYALMAHIAQAGFSIAIHNDLRFPALIADPKAELVRVYGDAVANDKLAKSDTGQLVRHIREFLSTGPARKLDRIASMEDIRAYVFDGSYLVLNINQKVLQADPGYVGHYILIYGFSDRGVRIHNPGPPATRASEITWELLDKAWSYPSSAARYLIAFKPT